MFRTKLRRYAATVMLLSFTFAAAAPAMAGGLMRVTDIAGSSASTIYFGSYWQSAATGYIPTGTDHYPETFNQNNYVKESIKWRVLAANAPLDPNDATKKGVLLLSDRGLYADEFNEHADDGSGGYVYGHDKNISAADANKWETSDIRKTLNGTAAAPEKTTFNSSTGTVAAWGSFAGDAFSAEEYKAIADTRHAAGGSYPGCDALSTDKIFLLSYEEVNNPDYGFANVPYENCPSDTRKATATEMARHVNMYGNIAAASVSADISQWWLRSPGSTGIHTYNVTSTGYASADIFVYNVDYTVRPALNLNQESVLFLSAAEGGKGVVNVGSGFTLDNTYAGTDGWKLTLKDASIAAPANVSVTQTTAGGVDDLAAAAAEGGTLDLTSGVTVSYSAPVVKYTAQAITDGKADYVSGIAANSAGEYVNYAKISGDASNTTGVSVGFGNLADGTYKMFVFAEQIGKAANGSTDYQTDYASAFSNTEGYEFTKGPAGTVNENTLSTAYADKNLTAELGGDFNLSFENETYNTGVTVGANDNGTITADAAGGTTLTGSVAVGIGATLTTEKEFKFTGDVEVSGTLFDKDSIEIADTLGTGDGALLKGEDETTSVLTTKKLNGDGTLTVENITLYVTEDGNIAGNLVLEESTLKGGEITVRGDLESKSGTIGGDVTVEGTTIVDPKLVIEEDTTLHTEEVVVKGPEGTIEGRDKNSSVIDTGRITGEGNVVIEGVTTNVSGNVDVKGDLTITDAEMDVEGDVDVKGNVDGKNSEINVKGKTTVEGNVVLDNSSINSGNITIKGNTETKNGSEIKGKVKFEGTLSFNLDGENKKNGYVFLKVDEAADLSGVTEVWLIQTDEYYKLNKGETMTLITKAKNYMGDPKVEERGINGERNYKYIYGVGIDENSALMLSYLDQGIADQTKSFSEARLAGSAAINSASDLVATAVMENAKAESKDWEAFAAIQGSHSRYETGSHIDLNSTNVAAGLSKKIKDNVTLGLFVEGGNGRYTTENEFEDGNVRADGDINYFGGGVFAKAEGKKTAKGQLHGEASFRAGHMNSDYNSETFNPGESTRFDTSSAYMGAHAGLGYKWSLKDNSNIDTYVKYLWNRQNSDSPVIDGEKFDLDAVNSHRLRAGFRYNGKENENGVKFFGGLAYEYEFDGVAKGRMGEYALLEPDFKGGSGMAELGIKYHKADSPWKVELGVTGYTGKRDSIGANLSAWYEFNGRKR